MKTYAKEVWIIIYVLLSGLLLTACSRLPPVEQYNHWKGIVPGETSKEDVRSILGEPNDISNRPFPNTGYDEKTIVWEYNSVQEGQSWLCATTCEIYSWIWFLEENVELITLHIVGELRDVEYIEGLFGEPELQGSKKCMPYETSRIDELEEKGIDFFTWVTDWIYLYPEKGLSLHFGPKYSEEGKIYYPRNSVAPEDMPLTVVSIYESMTLEEYRNSKIIYQDHLYLFSDE
jgi:hypothetical protein